MEDARKKRDSDLGKDEAVLPPDGKKQRSVRESQPADDTTKEPNETTPEGKILNDNQLQDILSDQSRTWDLESALHRIVRLGSSSNLSSTRNNSNKNDISTADANESSNDFLEKISPTTTLNFRMGHAGDASTIAELYRSWQTDTARGRAEPTNETSTDDADDEHGTANREITNQHEATTTAADDLEVWLADAVGNEDVPPCAFVLIAETRECSAEKDADNNDVDKASAPSSPTPSDQNLLVALAIMTQVWEDAARMLRIEWLYVRRDHELAGLIERRMWLRLSTLAIMTQSEGIIVKESVKDLSKDCHDVDNNDSGIDSES